MNPTPQQLSQLASLGINKRSSPSIVPLLSISGLTLISFGGLILFKSQKTDPKPPPTVKKAIDPLPSPTQVPKSIQHYLLASQQYFTQALSLQSSQPSSAELISLLNQSITAASEAIILFPQDFRGYEQRGKIYQSISDSQPQIVPQAIADLSHASELNPSSADLTRNIASLYAKQGKVADTISYLTRTVSLEPTKAQNFYDLANLQQRAGLLPAAIDTYNHLLTLISDPNQASQIKTVRDSLSHLLSQNQNSNNYYSIIPSPSPSIVRFDSPTIQALLLPTPGQSAPSSLIIAAPKQSTNVSVSSLIDTNSLSGKSLLPAGQKTITLSNSHLNRSKQVYVSLLKGGKNLSLEVISKTNTQFTVGLTEPASEDIEFQWWIIEN